MSDAKKSKAAALNSKAIAVVKSAAVKAKVEYFEFDAYAEAARIMGLRIDELAEHKDGWPLALVDDLEHWYRAFAAGREIFERDELYRTRKTSRQDLTGTWKTHEITRRVVTEKIGLLIGSFPNAGPHNAEAYIGMMIEEIIAANPSASALEATCRELRRTKNFAPSIAEMLKELQAQAEKWDASLQLWEEEIAYWNKRRQELVAAAKAQAVKQAEKKREREAEEERRLERNAQWRAVNGIGSKPN